MQLIVKGKNIEVSDSLREYADKKIGTLKKYFDNIIEVDITFILSNNKAIDKRQTVDTTLWANGISVNATESTEDMYASIDLVTEKLEKQIKKYKDKLKNRTRKHVGKKNLDAKHSVLSYIEDNDNDDNAKGKIIRTRNFELKPMFSEDAALELSALKQEFLIFSNADNEHINVIYKRKDGNFGLIEPNK